MAKKIMYKVQPKSCKTVHLKDKKFIKGSPVMMDEKTVKKYQSGDLSYSKIEVEVKEKKTLTLKPNGDAGADNTKK